MKHDKTNPLRLSIKTLSSSLESTGAPPRVTPQMANQLEGTPQLANQLESASRPDTPQSLTTPIAAPKSGTPQLVTSFSNPTSKEKDDNKEIKSTSQLKMASLGLQKALEQWDNLADGDRKQSPHEKALEDMKILLKELKEKLAQFE